MYKKSLLLVSSLSCLLIVGAGCSALDSTPKATSTLETRLELSNNDAERANYTAEVKTQMDMYNDNIAALQTRVRELNSSTQAQYKEALVDFQKKQTVAQKDYDDLKNATTQTWMSAKSRLELSMQAMKQSYENLKLQMNGNTEGQLETNP